MYRLKRNELLSLIDYTTGLLDIRSYTGFCDSMLAIQSLFAFEFVHVGSVSFFDEWKVQTFYTNITDMDDWSLYATSASSGGSDPVFNMVSAGKTLLWWEELPQALNGTINFPQNSFMRGYSCSSSAPDRSKSAVISFGGKNFEPSERTEALLGKLRPHICAAYFRMSEMKDSETEILSARELNVLRWLKSGKTSWEISKILMISENTVNFHIKNIKRKLNASNRQHAVAIALANSIIS